MSAAHVSDPGTGEWRAAVGECRVGTGGYGSVRPRVGGRSVTAPQADLKVRLYDYLADLIPVLT